jgi:hypothetical protein
MSVRVDLQGISTDYFIDRRGALGVMTASVHYWNTKRQGFLPECEGFLFEQCLWIADSGIFCGFCTKGAVLHVIQDIILVSAPWFHPCLSCGIFEIPGANGSCNVKAGDHVHIGQSWGHRAVTKKEGVDAIRPEVASRYQEVFVFWGLGQR